MARVWTPISCSSHGIPFLCYFSATGDCLFLFQGLCLFSLTCLTAFPHCCVCLTCLSVALLPLFLCASFSLTHSLFSLSPFLYLSCQLITFVCLAGPVLAPWPTLLNYLHQSPVPGSPACVQGRGQMPLPGFR